MEAREGTRGVERIVAAAETEERGSGGAAGAGAPGVLGRSGSRPRERGFDGAPGRRARAGLAAALGLALFALFRGPISHDVAWYLHMAGAVLDGGTLYVDVVDPNPPLVVFLMLPAALLSRWTGVPDVEVFRGAVLLAAAASLALAWRHFRAAFPGWPAACRQALLVLLAVVLVALPGYEFGQREHLALLLSLPYLLAATALAGAVEDPGASGGRAGRAAAVATGLMAGAAVSLKPFFLPLWLGIELCLASRRGRGVWRRPENVGILLFLLGYLAAILIWAPEYGRVARWAAGAYGDYAPGDRYALLERVLWLAGLGLLSSRLLLGRRPLAGLRTVGLIALLAFLAAVVVQNKGWAYHWFPAEATLVILAGAGLLDLVARGLAPARARAAIPALAAAVALAAAGSSVVRAERSWEWLEREQRFEELEALLERQPEGARVAALSMTVQGIFPAVTYAGAHYASTFNALWPLPALYRADPAVPGGSFPYHRPEAAPALERFVMEAVSRDVACGRPALLLADRRPPAPGMAGFDVLEYLSLDARARAALSDYEEVGDAGRYRVLERRGGPAPRGCGATPPPAGAPPPSPPGAPGGSSSLRPGRTSGVPAGTPHQSSASTRRFHRAPISAALSLARSGNRVFR